MKRIIKLFFAAIFVFIIVNFFLSNTGPGNNNLSTAISFRFNLPPFLSFQSMDFAVGYLLVLSFILGMVFAAIIGGLNAFSSNKVLKEQKRKISMSEEEIATLREELRTERKKHQSSSNQANENDLPIG